MINLVHTDSNRTVLGMQDDLGIVYLIESAQQFWSGEHIMSPGVFIELNSLQSSRISYDCHSTSRRRCPCWMPPCVVSLLFVRHTMARVQHLNYPDLAKTYPTEQFLQSPLQLEHACELILDSELFEFHSERMLDIITDNAQTVRMHDSI